MPRGQCSRAPVKPGGRCKLHGGASLEGIASATYKGHGYSKYLPRRLMDDYNAALNDPELGELLSEIALVEARMSEIIRLLGTGESGSGWRAAQTQMTQLIVTLQSAQPDPIAQANALSALRDTIGRGFGDSLLWDELRTLIEAKRRLVETEQRRLIAGKMYLTMDKAGLLIDALIRAVTTHVADRAILAAIQSDWNRVLAPAGERSIQSSDE